MKTRSSKESDIVRSWMKNASPWIKAVQNEEIESRKLVTDRAIVEAVLSCRPRSAIDIGCGEGWLTRKLTGHGIATTGIDVVPELIEAARENGGGEFHLLPYSDINANHFATAVDVLVANFSLLGKESVEDIFRSAAELLTPQGAFIIQTLHPSLYASDGTDYQDGWREGSWSGFGDEFSDPAPWYFRTLNNWIKLFCEHQMRLCELIEPIHPATGQPASVIFIGRIN